MGELDFPARRARALEWMHLAEKQLRSYEWEPTDLEAAIAEQLMRAVPCPTRTPPPYVGEELWARLLRLSGWAPVLRLAMMAGGWQLQVDDDDQVVEIGSPEPGVKATLERLLAAVYLLADIVEEWNRDHNDQRGRVPNERAAAGVMTQQVPGLVEHLAAAERFFIGPGSVREMFAVIATGLVD